MDTFEILSTIRNYSGLDTEAKIGTPLLKRLANMGYMYVAQMLLPVYHPFLVVTRESTAQTGASIPIPGDVLKILDAERKNTAEIYKLCTEVPVMDKGLIGKNQNYPNDEDYPAFVHEGREGYFFPILATTDVKLRYRRRIADLSEGKATYAGLVPSGGTSLTLGGNAVADDDFYNSYDIAVYTESGTDVELVGIYKVTDFTGSTKRATLTDASLDEQAYRYALIPILPNEYHHLIVDAGLIELEKAGKMEGNWKQDLDALNGRIKMILEVNGIGKN